MGRQAKCRKEPPRQAGCKQGQTARFKLHEQGGGGRCMEVDENGSRRRGTAAGEGSDSPEGAVAGGAAAVVPLAARDDDTLAERALQAGVDVNGDGPGMRRHRGKTPCLAAGQRPTGAQGCVHMLDHVADHLVAALGAATLGPPPPPLPCTL